MGYDGNADDNIDDAGDDLVATSPFGSMVITPSHDDNGNLTDDGTYKYTYGRGLLDWRLRQGDRGDRTQWA